MKADGLVSCPPSSRLPGRWTLAAGGLVVTGCLVYLAYRALWKPSPTKASDCAAIAKRVTYLKGLRPESDSNHATGEEIIPFFQKLGIEQVQSLHGNDHWRQVLENHPKRAAVHIAAEVLVEIVGQDGSALTNDGDRAFAAILRVLAEDCSSSKELPERVKNIAVALAKRGLPELSHTAALPLMRCIKVKINSVPRRQHAQPTTVKHPGSKTTFQWNCPSEARKQAPISSTPVKKRSLKSSELEAARQTLSNPSEGADLLVSIDEASRQRLFKRFGSDEEAWVCVWRALHGGQAGQQPHIKQELLSCASTAYKLVTPETLAACAAEDKMWQLMDCGRVSVLQNLSTQHLEQMLRYYQQLLNQAPKTEDRQLIRQKEHLAYVELAFVAMVQAGDSLNSDPQETQKMAIFTQFCEAIQSEDRRSKWGDINKSTEAKKTGNLLIDDLLLRVVHGFELAKKVIDSWKRRRNK